MKVFSNASAKKERHESFKFWAFVGPFQVTSWQWKAPIVMCCDFVVIFFCLFGWLVLFFVAVFCFSFSMSTFSSSDLQSFFFFFFFFFCASGFCLFIYFIFFPCQENEQILKEKKKNAVAEDEVYWRTTKWETKQRHSYSLLYPGVKSVSLKRAKDQRILLETLSHLEALLASHHFFIAYFCKVEVVDCFYVALFSTLKQTHCVRTCYCMTD